MHKQEISPRFAAHAGIAIGPILFIVAILAVLVMALAKGSGGFGSSTTEETNRINATTLIEQGTSIKSAMDRLLVNGNELNTIIVSPTFSNANMDAALYAPSGGGLTPQVPTPAVIAPNASWTFVPAANLPGVGSSGPNDFVTAIEVKSEAVCKALNSLIFGKSAPQVAALPTASPSLLVTLATVNNNDEVAPTGNSMDLSVSGLSSPLGGRTQACFSDGAATPHFYYYQIISAG